MLILGKCLEPYLATSKHAVTGSSLLLGTEERPASSLGPQLCVPSKSVASCCPGVWLGL